MNFQCANCQRPFGWHCEIHVIPCCPGKCPGKENRHLGPLEGQSPGRLVSGEGAHVARYPNASDGSTS